MGMSYTVIGASGFVGARLAASLRGGGHAVYAPQRGDPELLRRPLGRVIYCAGMTADYAARPLLSNAVYAAKPPPRARCRFTRCTRRSLCTRSKFIRADSYASCCCSTWRKSPEPTR